MAIDETFENLPLDHRAGHLGFLDGSKLIVTIVVLLDLELRSVAVLQILLELENGRLLELRNDSDRRCHSVARFYKERIEKLILGFSPCRIRALLY